MALIVLNPPKPLAGAKNQKSLEGVKVDPRGFTFNGDKVNISNLEEFTATVNTNPNLVPLTAIIRAWKSLGLEDDLIIIELNKVQGLGTIIKKSIEVGTPDASLSPLEILSQKVFERVIDYIKKAGRDYCISLLGKLYNAFGSNKYIGPFIKFLVEKAGAEICTELIELLDKEVFRKYVVPFINDLINFELISRDVGGFKFYGSTPIEKAEIARVLSSLKEVSDRLKEFARPIADDSGNLLLPSDGAKDFSGGNKTEEDEEEDRTKQIILFGTLALGCVAVYAIVNRRDDTYYGATPYAYPPPQQIQYYPPQYFGTNAVR